MGPTENTQRATRVIIRLGAISHNVAAIRKKIGNGSGLMAVVKANGYGHGAVEVSRVALASGADSLGVALPEEGQELREAGMEAPVLVLGLIQPEEAYKIVRFRLAQAVDSIELLEALNLEADRAFTKVDIHVKLDTGMERIGLSPDEAVSFIRRVKDFRNLNLKGVFSHFSSADEKDKTFSKQQTHLFDQVIRDLELAGIQIPQKHMANSAAILEIPESYYDMVRPGIMIYGLYPSLEISRTIKLEAAMTLKTRVVRVKRVPARTPIGYGRTFVTKRETTVATLPIGYADGYSRHLSNRGEVLIRGRRAPITGTICMDMCMIDVSGIEGVRPGDDVILFGDGLPVDEVADKAGTISYEVVSTIGKRLPRVYVD